MKKQYTQVNKYGYKIDAKIFDRNPVPDKDGDWVVSVVDHICPDCGGTRWLDSNNSCYCHQD